MTYFNYTTGQNLGWECPKCGNCYSPTVQQCISCRNDSVHVPFMQRDEYGLPAIVCTCGQTIVCTLHGGSDRTWTSSEVTLDIEPGTSTTTNLGKYPASDFYDEHGNLNPVHTQFIPFQQDATYKEGVKWDAEVDDALEYGGYTWMPVNRRCWEVIRNRSDWSKNKSVEITDYTTIYFRLGIPDLDHIHYIQVIDGDVENEFYKEDIEFSPSPHSVQLEVAQATDDEGSTTTEIKFLSPCDCHGLGPCLVKKCKYGAFNHD